ncbi:MAG: succinylglutamate desuccinylase, partial [Thioalkalispiraceae bacterium]
KRTENVKRPYIARSRYWVRAPHAGILRNIKKLGDHVHKDERLGTISDPTDIFSQSEFPVHAGHAGIIIGRTNLPLVNEGDAIYHIAYFKDSTEVAQEVESFQQDFDTGL